MVEVDGSQKSGSGTILRLSIALAAVLSQPLHIFNIRQNRPEPGLKPQHLEAVLTAARLCHAELQGAQLGSRELWFNPGRIEGGRVESEIGTAGSIPMLLMTVLPICAFAEHTVSLHVSKGGTDVLHSPTINYMRFVFLPLLKRMGLNADLTVQKYGYYPKGMGEVTLIVEPSKSLKPLVLETSGNPRMIKGVSVCTFLEDRKVAERQANAATGFLKEKGCAADVRIVNDHSNPLQKGSSLVLWTETECGAVLGADAIGELRKSSEAVGKEAAEKLWTEISAKSTVDIHLADMLIPYVALAEGRSAYLARTMSEHLETNIWLAQQMLNVKLGLEKTGSVYKIEKLG
jgi:RNA 3'-terminal phosphate cyclase (ATP)